MNKRSRIDDLQAENAQLKRALKAYETRWERFCEGNRIETIASLVLRAVQIAYAKGFARSFGCWAPADTYSLEDVQATMELNWSSYFRTAKSELAKAMQDVHNEWPGLI